MRCKNLNFSKIYIILLSFRIVFSVRSVFVSFSRSFNRALCNCRYFSALLYYFCLSLPLFLLSLRNPRFHFSLLFISLAIFFFASHPYPCLDI